MRDELRKNMMAVSASELHTDDAAYCGNLNKNKIKRKVAAKKINAKKELSQDRCEGGTNGIKLREHIHRNTNTIDKFSAKTE